MNKRKILITILLIAIIAILAFLAFTIREMITLKNLNKKVAQSVNNNEHYEKIINNSGNTTTITEYYCKGNNAVLFLNTTLKATGETRKLTNYFKGDKVNSYIESGEDKIALLNTNGVPSKVMIRQVDAGNNLWELFLMSLATSIRSEECNGKDCYVLSLGENSKTYIDKETGLTLKAIEGTVVDENGNESVQTMQYHYEFDNVDDNIFVEPDISKYKIQENN